MNPIVFSLSLIATLTLSCKSPESSYEQKVAAADSSIKKIQASAIASGYLSIKGTSINYCAHFLPDQTCKVVRQFSTSGKVESVGNGPCNLDTIGGSNDYLELNLNGKMIANVKTSAPYSGSDVLFQGQSEMWSFSSVSCLSGMLGETSYAGIDPPNNTSANNTPINNTSTDNSFSINVTSHTNYGSINKVGINWTLNASRSMKCRIDGTVRAQVQKSSSSPIETKTIKYESATDVTPGRSRYTSIEFINNFKTLKLYSADLDFICDGISKSKFISLL